MPRKHLASLARENEAALKTRYQQHLAGHPHAKVIEELYETCEPIWTVSINAPADRAHNLLKHGEYYNKYQSVAKSAFPVFIPVEEAVPGESPVNWTLFGPYLCRDPKDAVYAKKREAFNRFAQHEEHFAYGIYYVRGEGASRYGGFQIIFSRDKVLTWEGLSFLQQDSLNYCRQVPGGSDTDWAMDEAHLAASLATALSVTELMCLKMPTDVLAEGVECCIGNICVAKEDGENYEYVEAHLESGYDISSIARVVSPELNLFQKDILTRFLQIDYSALNDRDLTADEREVKYFLLACAEINDKF